MISLSDNMNRMKTIHRFLLPLLLLLAVLPARGFNLRKINDAENLSSSSIFSFHQDKQGLMRIGTGRGVDIYDGRHINPFNPGSSLHSFTGSKIEKIDQTGHTLWLQTYHGLHKIDLQTGAAHSFEMFNRVAFQDKDSRGNIYLVQGNNSIYYTLKGQTQFEQKFISGLAVSSISDFFIDKSDMLWIVMRNGIIRCYSLQLNKEGNIDFLSSPGHAHSNGILSCAHDADNLLYFVDDTYTLYELNTITRQVLPVYSLKDLLSAEQIITSLLKFHDDYFIGFKAGGLSVLRKTDEGFTLNPLDLPAEITCLYKDKFQDMIWIGTHGHGVYTYSLDMYSIRSIPLDDFPLKMRQPVSALYLDSDNTLWLGSRGDGILRISNFHSDKKINDLPAERFTASNSGLRDNMIFCLSPSRQGNLWIGSEHGLSYWSRQDNRIVSVPLSSGGQNIRSISDIYEHDSLLWVSTLGMGVVEAKLDWHNNQPLLAFRRQFTVRKEDEFTNRFSAMYPENDTLLWCTNKGEGLYHLNTYTGEWQNIRFEGNIINETNDICRDIRGNYLVGTNYGLIRCDAGGCRMMNEANPSPTNSIYGILPDSPTNYWLSTNRGLILYNIDNGLFRTYDQHDGLSVLEFNEGAAFRSENNGTLLFGGTNGIVTIRRNYFDDAQHYVPPVYFRTVTIRDKTYPIEQFYSSVGNHTRLELSHDRNFFTLSFSATDHLNGNSYSYYYKLHGNEWISNGNSNAITFADLHPGHYTLYVKYHNKVLGKDSYTYKLNIRVFPPWYASSWAYLFYVVFALMLAALVLHLWLANIRKKKADRRRQMEQKHKVEIYESKLRFFTNISHEFCTPLTLIYGPCNRLMEQKNLTAPTRKYASIIKQNAERLNALIQDLIEFNRIESGYKKPAIARVDMTALADKLAESFTDMAESRAIGFQKEIASSIQWNTDEGFIVTILLNLLSNAFKYAAGDRQVRLRIEAVTDQLCITVSNTGKGIAQQDIPNLFDRYHILQNLEQNDASSFWSRNGLGLAISYNMVRLLDGTIEVESIPNGWTHFRVKLPFLAASDLPVAKDESLPLPDYSLQPVPALQIPRCNPDEQKPTLLVVDDDTDILWLLYDIFNDEYNVLTAANSADGLALLQDTHPDLIISDVIMPGTDGLTFSRQVKQDETTAHIPFILLSAKRDIEGQTEGLNAGAELYITKPFHVEYLKSSVQRLLERKESLREYFSSPLSSYTFEKGKYAHQEQKKFVNDILKIINKNLKNKELSAQLIAGKMNIGLRTFYRKLEEIEDTTLAELINNCRLLKAADLLMKTKLTIDEIVFQSGFTNRSTFYRAFSKKYNCTPTEYRKQQG